MESTHTVDAHTLLSLTGRCLEELGVPTEDAEVVADVLIDANLTGTPSHGFQRLPAYMRRVHAGVAGGTQRFSVVCEVGGLCRIDAGNALGPAAAAKALDHAIRLARQFGVSLVAVGASGHFGSAGYYARRAAESGMVAMVMTNSVKRIAPYGATEAFLGTNPLAIGVPLGSQDPFVLDMASSIEAGGKVMRAKKLGEPLPPGIALDCGGRPTCDPASALAGALLPMAGPKGSGLALAISLLAVLLGGADSDDTIASLHNDVGRPQNVGHVFIVVDVSKVTSGAEERALTEMLDRLVALAPSDPSNVVRYPGQGKRDLVQRRWSEGVPIESSELSAAANTCRTCGLDDLAEEFLDLEGRRQRVRLA